MKRIIAIEGIDCAGKSFVANALSKYFNIPIIRRDQSNVYEALSLLNRSKLDDGCKLLFNSHITTLSENQHIIVLYDRFLKSTISSLRIINPGFIIPNYNLKYKVEYVLIIRDKSSIINFLGKIKKRDWFENTLFMHNQYIDVIQDDLLSEIDNVIINKNISKNDLINQSIQLISTLI